MSVICVFMKNLGGDIGLIRVGFRVPDWATQFNLALQGLLAYVRKNNLNWKVEGAFPAAQEVESTTIDSNWRGDGVIVFRPSPEELDAWLAKGIAVVNLSSEATSPRVSSVYCDNFQMGRLAANHLLKLGLQHFAYVGSEAKKYSRERCAGYTSVLSDAGMTTLKLDVPVESFPDEDRARRIQLAMRKPLERLPKPIGVLVRDDITAVALLHCARSLGIKVPGELAVLGVGDAFPHCQMAWPPLSSVACPSKELGFHAAKILEQEMKGDSLRVEERYPSLGVTERESTELVSIDDDLVMKVLVKIRGADHGLIDIAYLGEEFGISYSLLRKRFRAEVGHSIRDEVHRVRLELLRSTLLESSDSLQEIACEMQFSSVGSMSRFFTRHMGQSPTSFRESTHQLI